jgi:lysozyme
MRIIPSLALAAGLVLAGPSVRSQTSETVSARIQGLDVSHDQGQIDWSQVAAARRQFVFIKATQGITEADPDFKTNWQNAQEAGLLRGAYHYFQPGDDPLAQAKNFLSVATLQPGDLPPVLDIEVQGDLTASQLLQDVRAWLEAVREKTGVVPILYTDPGFWNTLGAQGFSEYPLWVAAPNGDSEPSLPTGWTSWLFWQYSQAGTVPGITPQVDLDVFQGSFEELRGLTVGPTAGH